MPGYDGKVPGVEGRVVGPALPRTSLDSCSPSLAIAMPARTTGATGAGSPGREAMIFLALSNDPRITGNVPSIRNVYSLFMPGFIFYLAPITIAMRLRDFNGAPLGEGQSAKQLGRRRVCKNQQPDPMSLFQT